MRTLSSTLTSAQKTFGNLICKIVLTSGANSYQYDLTTTNILMRVVHPEQPWSQTAKVLIRSQDNSLAALSLEGYQGVLSYGYNTSAGDEWSATAPLKVKAQELISSPGTLDCLLDLYGLPDQLGDDHASTAYTLTSSDTQTVKTLISAIMGATMACYSHCTAITVTYDSEDSLIDTFKPADYFRIMVGDTRKAKVRELLSWTKCVGIFKADGQFHISSPTVSGTTYNYEYDNIDLAANHTFFSKVYRNRLVLPNKIVVQSSPDHSAQYTGSATSATSFALLPKTDYKEIRLASNAQATSIAEALIQRLEAEHAKGNGFAPMNVGQEVYDYIKITDKNEGDNRVGNIGYLQRTFDITQRQPRYDIGFGFGDILLGGAIGFVGASGTGQGTTIIPQYVTFSDLYNMWDILDGNINSILDFLNTWDTVPKWHITDQAIAPVVV